MWFPTGLEVGGVPTRRRNTLCGRDAGSGMLPPQCRSQHRFEARGLGDPSIQPQGFDQVVHLVGRGAGHIGSRNLRPWDPIHSTARLEQGREEAALPNLGNPQLYIPSRRRQQPRAGTVTTIRASPVHHTVGRMDARWGAIAASTAASLDITSSQSRQLVVLIS